MHPPVGKSIILTRKPFHTVSTALITSTKRINFSSLKNPIDYPDFLEIQLKSFQDFFQLETTADNRQAEGLFKVFSENFPISDSRNNFVLEFLDYFIDPPRYTIDECIELELAFADAHLHVALLRTRSVTRTARAFGMTQPAVSRALRQLRAVFDDELLVAAHEGLNIVANQAARQQVTLDKHLEYALWLTLNDHPEGVTDQDAQILSYAVMRGKAVLLAVNKWDAVDAYQREWLQRSIETRLSFLKFARIHLISAKKRQGLGPLWQSLQLAYQAAMCKMSTPVLTRLLQEAVQFQAPKRSGMFRPKPRYAHQGGMNPPVIVIHGNSLEHVTDSYKRFLEGRFRKAFDLEGTPLRIEMKTSHNPYAE